MPWHRDPHHRVTVVMHGDALAIEYRDGNPTQRFAVGPGQVDWDEPTDLIHLGVNVGDQPYEEIVVFLLALLARPGSIPQPKLDEG
jgi:hypothetical protein